MRVRLTLPTLFRTVPLTTPSETSQRVDVAALYRAHAARVAGWAAHLGGPAIDVDDIVQEVFLVARRKLPDFRDEGGRITTWLFRITEKIVQSVRRRQRVRRWLRHGSEDEVPGMGSAQPGPDDALERRQKIQSVYTVLDTLPENQRRVLVLFEIEGLATQTIAELIGVRLGTVRVRLHRARSRFLQEYERQILHQPETGSEAGSDRGWRP